MAATTTAATARTNGQQVLELGRPAGLRGPGRHRQFSMAVVGVLLVLGCALAFTDASLHLGSREEVLVVAQPLDAGQVLTAGDLRTVRVSTGSGLQAVGVGAESSVVGRRVAVPLVAGALLTSSEVGAVPPVGSGSDEVAIGLKAGAYPPDLAAGDRILVVPVTSSSGGGTGTTGARGGRAVAATVLGVEVAAADSDDPTVFSLQVLSGDAVVVASLAASGDASLVEVGEGS